MHNRTGTKNHAVQLWPAGCARWSVRRPKKTAPKRRFFFQHRLERLRLADEIVLADIRARYTQDRVRGRAVEKQVRQHEVQQVGIAFEWLVAMTRLDRHLAGFAAIDLLGLEGLDVVDGALDARVQLLEGGFVVFEFQQLDTGETGDAVLG